MDDFIANVRQIVQYPQVGVPGSTDAVLLQQGGLGGPYGWTTPSGLLRAGATALDPVAFSGPVTIGSLTLGELDFASVGSVEAPNGFVFTSHGLPVLTIDGNGWALAEQVTLGRDPTSPMEAVTLQFLLENTVYSFNGRRGDIHLQLSDLVDAGGAPLNSPSFAGWATAPNYDGDDRSQLIANTAFVWNAIDKAMQHLLACQPLVFSFNGRSGNVFLSLPDVLDVGGAPIFSPAFRGQPTAPDPILSDYSNRIVTTRWVNWQIDDVNARIGNLEQVVQQQIDESALATMDWVIGNFAPIIGAALQGYVTAPTPPPGTVNAQIATTAFVMAAVAESVAGVVTWNGRSGNVVLQTADVTAVGGALLASPAFTGIPTGPTATAGTANTQLATTEFVMSAVQAIDAGVETFNGRSGVVNLTWADVQGVGGAPLNAPALTGVPTAPTAAAGTANTQLATTAFVQAAIATINTGVISFNGRAGAITLTANDISAAGGAPITSPGFAGIPTAPTAAPGTATTQLATTAFVMAALAATAGVTSFNGRAGAITFTVGDLTGVGGATQAWVTTQLGSYLPLAGGTMTGTLNSNGWLDNNPSLRLSAAALPGSFNTSDVILDWHADSVPGGIGGGVRFNNYKNASGSEIYLRTAPAAKIYANMTTASFEISVSPSGTANTAITSAAISSFQSNGDLSIPNRFFFGDQISNGAFHLGASATDVWVSFSIDQWRMGFQRATGTWGYIRGTDGAWLFFIDGNAALRISGNAFKPGGGVWADSSDARIKDVVGDYEHGLAEIVALSPKRFTYKGNDTRDALDRNARVPYVQSGHHDAALAKSEYIGLIAQDTEGPMPELVSVQEGFIDGEKVDDLRNIDATPLVYALINAVKTLNARVTALEAEARPST